MITSGGSARNRSTTKMISQFSGRMPSQRINASARPAAMPVTTTQAPGTNGQPKPGDDVGQVFRHDRGVEEGVANGHAGQLGAGSG